MIQSIKDILVVSDMDGTLLTDDKALLPSTLESIRLFTSLGGRFTLATGRGVESVSRYGELLPLLAPVIANNGTIIYNFKEEKALKNLTLPKLIAKKALQEFCERFPKAGAMVFAADFRCYQVQASSYAQILIDTEGLSVVARPFEDLPPDWNKILFAASPEMIEDMELYAEEKLFPGVYFVHTAPIYFEIMPQGISKGSALREYCAGQGISPENTIVIGDYYNDLEMMAFAGRAVAVSNAPADVRLQADEICQSNNEGGVGQFLYELVKRYG